MPPTKCVKGARSVQNCMYTLQLVQRGQSNMAVQLFTSPPSLPPSLTDHNVWSKLETGRLPSMEDLRLMMEDPALLGVRGEDPGPTIISLPS